MPDKVPVAPSEQRYLQPCLRPWVGVDTWSSACLQIRQRKKTAVEKAALEENRDHEHSYHNPVTDRYTNHKYLHLCPNAQGTCYH